MVTCDVCGSEDFEKHAGFMYCSVCQTQSQDYHEQEYEYRDHEMNLSRRQKSQTPVMKSVRQEVYDDGLWTTWEAFNYILYGMLDEMKKCGASKEFEEMVFKLWGAYLRHCKAAFTSRFEEKIPKLRFGFKHRDARVLYNIDVASNVSRKRKLRSRSCGSKVSNTSNSTQSKRSLVIQKRKIITSDYQDHLSLSMQSNSNLADETLESLGRSSEFETTDESSDDSENLVNSFKHMFSRKDFKLYKESINSKKMKAYARYKATRDITYPAKNRLLSIIHLALLMTGSQIQLSDLLRFIRESHLSFAKMTHFFPKDVKFPRKDFSYVEVTTDISMPTHLRQRSITGQLACLLKIERIPAPNISLLIERYCQDLNLPKQVAELSRRILQDYVGVAIIPRNWTSLPSYEARAMASIIFVMKLLLGLNDQTEIFLSHLAVELNSTRGNSRSLFVFKEWQKFIECRKTVLTNFHYPTQEQLNGSHLENSGMFLDMLMKESKDEYRKNRYIPYPRYYIDEKFLTGVKQVLNALSTPQKVTSFEFKPSLTPQTSHTEIIMRNLSEGRTGAVEEGSVHQTAATAFPEEILKQSFAECDLQFAVDPNNCLKLLDKNCHLFNKFGICQDSSVGESLQKRPANQNFFLDCSSRYWLLHYPDAASRQLCNFKEEILEKTPKNFQWFLKECARMLEMNVRDLYNELILLEKIHKP